VQKILIDCGELIPEHAIQMLNNRGVALHFLFSAMSG
jgi:hypothetical protein